MTVLIAEGMHEAGIRILQNRKIRTVTPQDSFEADEVAAVIVRSVYEVNATTVKKYPNLGVVAKLGTGLDNIDLDFCRESGIPVINAEGVNAVSTAEFTVMQILNIYKNAFAIYDGTKTKDYRRATLYGRELSGLTAGIIGYGYVGQNIASRLAPFVKRLLISTRSDVNKEKPADNAEFIDEPEMLLKESDAVVLAVSLKGNVKMVNTSFLSKLKKNVMLLNPARGGIIDEDALAEFLKSNKKAVYWCDVMTKEPEYHLSPEKQNYQNKLLGLPNVIFTPHIAGMTEECQEKISVVIAEKVSQALENSKSEVVYDAKG